MKKYGGWRPRKFWVSVAVALVFITFTGLTFAPNILRAKIKSEVLVLGHAGSGFMSPVYPFNPLPSNSLGSIVKAMEDHSADGVEVDVQLSRDGVPILYHDVTLESMTEETGLIEEHLASEVIGLKYKGGFFYDLFHDEEIITMETMLQRFVSYPELPIMHLDLRNHNPERHAYYAKTLLGLLQKYNYPMHKLMFISPNPEFLEAFRSINPQAPLMLDSGKDFRGGFKVVQEHKFQGICLNGSGVTHNQVLKAKEHGIQVALFGGKSRSRIDKMIKLEPDAIQVNNVEAMRNLLR